MDTGPGDTKWLTFQYCILPSIDVYKADRLQEHQRIHSGYIQQGSGQAWVYFPLDSGAEMRY